MKYAIIGLGFIYPRHKQAIEKTGGEIILTCDNDLNKPADFSNWREMYESPKFQEVDAVVICTPNYLHREMAAEALKLGKRVLCEKPLTINGIEGLDGVNVVLQLRYAPQILLLKNRVIKDVKVIARMFRDETYFKSWKGDAEKSGGLLFNLGVHYLDLLLFLLGNDYETGEFTMPGKNYSYGTLKYKDKTGHFEIEIVDDKTKQERYIEIDGEKIILSDKDNLSYEDLHTEVYKHFIAGDGIPLSEAKKSINLIEKIYGK